MCGMSVIVSGSVNMCVSECAPVFVFPKASQCRILYFNRDLEIADAK